jgi:hypothetical protein
MEFGDQLHAPAIIPSWEKSGYLLIRAGLKVSVKIHIFSAYRDSNPGSSSPLDNSNTRRVKQEGNYGETKRRRKMVGGRILENENNFA